MILFLKKIYNYFQASLEELHSYNESNYLILKDNS